MLYGDEGQNHRKTRLAEVEGVGGIAKREYTETGRCW